MKYDNQVFQTYLEILKEELIPALGCTEPIAVAFAAAKAREVLGKMPERMIARCSGNIVKNVKGVIVPMTKNLRGIAAAAILGAVGGNASKGLEVLADIKEEDLIRTQELLLKHMCEQEILETPAKLHIIIEAYIGEHSAKVEILHTHLGLVHIEKDGQTVFDIPHDAAEEEEGELDRSSLNIAEIYVFANNVEISDVMPILEKQVRYNTSISRVGLNESYGANIGKTLLETYGCDVKIRAKAAAAAGSDARMGGCELPVVINSGSGNQGMTVSLPVIEYARDMKVSDEKLYRALCMSNLVAIHQKSKIGRLSAYCGAVSAAAGAGAGIAYLMDMNVYEISETIISTLANVSGIVCDGAKASCAAKIASSVDAAIMAVEMTNHGRSFRSGEGIVKNDVESTIESVTRMAREGMRETDEEILKIMIDQ
ncbi:MAG: L-serine ammonia-lyase, iron-sulfur-dependent, subunit alpha [Oscillospiraceae bacterium]|nr:L-serine ammonia-lyase, iron-sulfur-dependent, subunit alpha [Oscillospiraceae bacterium]